MYFLKILVSLFDFIKVLYLDNKYYSDDLLTSKFLDSENKNIAIA